ncbi:hypothetical protein [Actinoplanes philippinensis]|nr:hypothetical protein [Actinoplanes philippinensis]
MDDIREAPATVRVAFVIWLAAVGAGTVETVPVVTAALPGSTPAGLVFGAVRTLHVIAVLTATALMFTPPSNRWFRRRPGVAFRGARHAGGGHS